MVRVQESDYYIWLRDLVCDGITSYNQLIRQLDSTEYTWMFTMDANRAASGLNLRGRYSEEVSMDEDDVRTGPCSVLEMLIGVADNMDSQLCCGIEACFWKLIENLGLIEFTDKCYDSECVENILETWLNHDYSPDGVGSIFPLQNYPGDCRNIDIWTQMNAWINENYPETDDWLN